MLNHSRAFPEVKLKNKNQVTIPSAFIPQGTERFRITKHPDGYIMLIPMASIPIEQKWFWTSRWQEGERAASKELKSGQGIEFSSMKEATKALDRKRKSKK